MKYTIQWCELKKAGEKNGKPWQITTMHLRDEGGVLTENVDTFDTVVNGTTIEGEITTGQYGKNFVKAKAVAGTNFKTKQIEETMARKEKSIAGFQDNKEFSIMVTSSMNKAIELAIAENDVTPQNIQKWRKWIIANWNVEVTDTVPFN